MLSNYAKKYCAKHTFSNICIKCSNEILITSPPSTKDKSRLSMGYLLHLKFATVFLFYYPHYYHYYCHNIK